MTKAIFIDIDGTLRDSNRNLSARTIETIKKVSKKVYQLYYALEDHEDIQQK